MNISHSSLALHSRTSSASVKDDGNDFKKDREIRQFLDTVAVVPEYPKLPDISKYLTYKPTAVNKKKTTSDRSRVISSYMCVYWIHYHRRRWYYIFVLFFSRLNRNERATREKNAMIAAAKKTKATDRHKGIDMPQVYYHKKLIEFVDAMEPTPMRATEIENIIEV